MDQVNKAISNHLQTGQYFHDAKNWYLKLLIYPIIERSFLIIIALINVIIIFELFLTAYSLFPITEETPVNISISDSMYKIPIIKKIGHENESYQTSITRYVLENYVKNWETYNFEDIKRQNEAIKKSSSKYIFKKYYNYISLDNPNTWLIYQKQISRNIKIESTNINESENTAIIRFNATVIDYSNNQQTNTVWVAKIEYEISNLYDIDETISKPLGFTVINYQVSQIK